MIIQETKFHIQPSIALPLSTLNQKTGSPAELVYQERLLQGRKEVALLQKGHLLSLMGFLVSMHVTQYHGVSTNIITAFMRSNSTEKSLS
jgi:hypothetical protein